MYKNKVAAIDVSWSSKLYKVKMNYLSPQSSPVRQTESPEYMDVEGFEGFFYETTERRIVEFEDFIFVPENIDGVDGVLDKTDDNTLEIQQESEDDDERLLLNEILNFKGEVGMMLSQNLAELGCSGLTVCDVSSTQFRCWVYICSVCIICVHIQSNVFA